MVPTATDQRSTPRAPSARPDQRPTCADCGKRGDLVDGRAIYPHRPDLYDKRFYRCECGAYVGCHPGTTQALGSPAGAATRKARSAAHAAFDPIWKGKRLHRSQAYGRLAAALGIDPKDCHIGMMDATTAWRVVEVCRAGLPEKTVAQ